MEKKKRLSAKIQLRHEPPSLPTSGGKKSVLKGGPLSLQIMGLSRKGKQTGSKDYRKPRISLIYRVLEADKEVGKRKQSEV